VFLGDFLGRGLPALDLGLLRPLQLDLLVPFPWDLLQVLQG
jgi:hypothetical protein